VFQKIHGHEGRFKKINPNAKSSTGPEDVQRFRNMVKAGEPRSHIPS